jgi:hypothetical protein
MSIDFPKEEERILARWKEIDAFLTQVELVRHLIRLSSRGTRGTRAAVHSDAFMRRANIRCTVKRKGAIHFLRWSALRHGSAPLWPSPGLDHQGHHPALLVDEGALC